MSFKNFLLISASLSIGIVGLGYLKHLDRLLIDGNPLRFEISSWIYRVISFSIQFGIYIS